jgi:serine/threonine protein kinase
LKVLDFGIAKVMSHGAAAAAHGMTGPSLKAFSLAYAAPEQLDPGPKGYGATGPWTDVYALALIFVELVAARRAYDGSEFADIYAQAVGGRRPTLRNAGASCSDEVERVLERALAVDPRERYATAGLFWANLRDALQQAAVPTASATRTEEHTSAPAPRAGDRASWHQPTQPPLPTFSPHARPGEQRMRSSTAAPWIIGAAVGVVAIVVITFALGGTSPAEEPAVELPVPMEPGVSKKKPPKPVVPTPVPVNIEDEWVGKEVSEILGNSGESFKAPALDPARKSVPGKTVAWNWANQCYELAGQSKLGYARAACIKAMQVLEANPEADVKRMALFNFGLVEAAAGEFRIARAFYVASLKLGKFKDVENALKVLPDD